MTEAHILVAEDDSEMADVLRQGFELENYSVRVARDGGECLELSSLGFQAIVLDVMLPVLDGFEVAKALRGVGNATPILMLTACDSVTHIVRGLDSGAEDYLTKPFSFLELSARVRALVRRRQPAAVRLHAGDLVLDTSSHVVTRAGEAVQLTKTEYRLLEILLQNRGSVVRRKSLVGSIWGTMNVDDNNLDVTISALRAKIDKGRKSRLIETVRGFGYRILNEQGRP